MAHDKGLDTDANQDKNIINDNDKNKNIRLTRRDLIKLGIGIGTVVTIGYYSYTLLSKKPKKVPKVNISNVTGTVKHTPSIPVYYQIYLENGNAKALNVTKNSIDFQGDHYSVIQKCLNSLPSRNNKLKVALKGDFICDDTIKIPSYTIFELDGSVSLGNNINKILVQEADLNTTQIEMIGGTYDGNKDNQLSTASQDHVIKFSSVTSSHFSDMVVQNAVNDNFTLDTECSDNICENLVGREAGTGSSNTNDGNGLDDKGDHNTWTNCIAEDNFSDNWVIKCRNSTFINCIGRGSKNAVGFGLFADRDITGNKFQGCQGYDNKTTGMTINIPAKSAKNNFSIENNIIQGEFYDNGTSGIRFINESSNDVLSQNIVDVLVHNNETGFLIDKQMISNNSGTIVTYDNSSYDADIGGDSNNFDIYIQDMSLANKIKKELNNIVNINEIPCSESSQYWSIERYCQNK